MEKTIFLEPSVIYHVYNRGTNKQVIFFDKKDYTHFFTLWEKYTEPIADTFAFCLLANHFHFMIKIRDIQELMKIKKVSLLDECKINYYLSQQFSNLFNAYSKYFNKKYGRDGKVFRERFKRKEVNDDQYFKTLIEYIHTNPVKHGITSDYKNYEYSSYWMHLLLQPTRLKRDVVIDWYGSCENYINAHSTYEVG